jgi:gamma-glutamylcyclotransferase (GGCT)/AIG2-like uncharacterized protein YtfP
MTRIFVYGTLLRGFGNWSWALKDQTFVKEGETLPEYTMISLGGFPGVCPNGTTSIKGEVFDVDDTRMKEIDSLEGYRPDNPTSGMYDRQSITLVDGTEALIYIFNTGSRPLAGYSAIDSGSWREHRNQYEVKSTARRG